MEAQAVLSNVKVFQQPTGKFACLNPLAKEPVQLTKAEASLKLSIVEKKAASKITFTSPPQWDKGPEVAETIQQLVSKVTTSAAIAITVFFFGILAWALLREPLKRMLGVFRRGEPDSRSAMIAEDRQREAEMQAKKESGAS